MILAIVGQPLVTHILDPLFEEFLRVTTLTELLKLFEIQQATLFFIYNVKELFDVLQVNLDAVLLEHLLQLLGVKRPRRIIVEPEKNVLHVILRLKLCFSLNVEVLGCLLMPRHKPVLRAHLSHDAAYRPLHIHQHVR